MPYFQLQVLLLNPAVIPEANFTQDSETLMHVPRAENAPPQSLPYSNRNSRNALSSTVSQSIESTHNAPSTYTTLGEIGNSTLSIGPDIRTLAGSNTFARRHGPYSTPWVWDANCIWCRDLALRYKFTAIDGALFAFAVDCAMKIFILADLELPGQAASCGTSKLAWLVIRIAYEWARTAYLSTPAPCHVPLDVLLVFIHTTSHMSKIMERWSITIN